MMVVRKKEARILLSFKSDELSKGKDTRGKGVPGFTVLNRIRYVEREGLINSPAQRMQPRRNHNFPHSFLCQLGVVVS